MNDGDILNLRLRILPGDGPADAAQRVRSLLKVALRRFRLRSEGCRVETPPPPAKAPPSVRPPAGLEEQLLPGEFP